MSMNVSMTKITTALRMRHVQMDKELIGVTVSKDLQAMEHTVVSITYEFNTNANLSMKHSDT